MTYHRGITMHRLPVGGNAMGAVFAIGFVVMVVIGIPLARWFLLGSAALGVLFSVLLARWHRRHRIEINDLSALEESGDKTPRS